jgi:CTP:phosphocholine cytidylyltransferase-like protein
MLQWGTPYDLEIYKGWSLYFSNLKKTQSNFVDKLDTTTIFPMAGRGSRFQEQGYKNPKPLIKINDKPMFMEAIKCLPQSTNNLFICLQDHLDSYPILQEIHRYYPKSSIFGIKDVTDGQACTCDDGIKNCEVNLDNPILITACDNGVYYNVDRYQKLVDDDRNDIIVWTFRNNQSSKVNPSAYAWLEVDDNDYITRVSCKQYINGTDPLKTHAIIGTMFFRKGKYFTQGYKEMIRKNIRTNGEFYVDNVINENILQGLRVKVFEVDNYICWGTPNDYKTFLYWQDHFSYIN